MSTGDFGNTLWYSRCRNRLLKFLTNRIVRIRERGPAADEATPQEREHTIHRPCEETRMNKTRARAAKAPSSLTPIAALVA
jgi:hypothetical protein